VDVFYVTDLTGTKVSHPGRQAAIRRALLEVFEGEDGSETPLRAAP
jgi:[protein-PII] uridylyltransferase